MELEYAPRQTYSLDTTYSLEMPLVLDVNVATPLSGYESLSASFRHNARDTAMDASAQVSVLEGVESGGGWNREGGVIGRGV